MSTLKILAYSSSALWQKHGVAAAVVEQSLGGAYGLVPRYAYLNAHDKGHPLDGKWVPKILDRLAAGTMQSLDLAVERDDGPSMINLHIRKDPDVESILSIKVPLDFGSTTVSGLDRALAIVDQVIAVTHAEYLCAHDATDWVRLHNERRGHLLFIRSSARGAHWMTYFCGEDVKRLGGPQPLIAAPAYQARPVRGGILLISHPEPANMEMDPRRADIQRLHQYLQSLVQAEERP
jgi:hypothetical protein